MEKNEKNGEIIFKKYYPQHPLPKELIDLPQKETVCQYCGISYLIHSEIKKLEEEIIILNKKIRFYEDLEISERLYETKYCHVNDELNQLKLKFLSLEDNFSQLKKENDTCQMNLMNHIDDIVKLKSSLKFTQEDKDKLIAKQRHLFQNLFELKQNNQTLKDYLISIKSEINLIINTNIIQNRADIASICIVLGEVTDSYNLEIQQIEKDKKRLEFEISLLHNENSEKDQNIVNGGEKLKYMNDQTKRLIEENSFLNHELNEKLLIISHKEEVIGNSSKDAEKIKLSHQNEIDTHQNALKLLKQENNNSQELLTQERQSHNLSKSELKSLHSRLEKNSVENEELSKKCLILENEVNQLKTAMKIIQNEKINVEEENKNTLKTLKKRLLEYQETEKSMNIIKEEMNKQFENEKKSYLNDIAILKQEIVELQEIKRNYEAMEAENRNLQITLSQFKNNSISLLKKIEATENDSELQKDKVNKMVREYEEEIAEKEKIINDMEADLIKNRHEINTLQKMVHQECEERYELTESLNRAREQLLLIGEFNVNKTITNLPPIKQRHSTTSIISSASNSIKNPSIAIKMQNQVQNKGPHNSIISTKRKLEKLFNQ